MESSGISSVGDSSFSIPDKKDLSGVLAAAGGTTNLSPIRKGSRHDWNEPPNIPMAWTALLKQSFSAWSEDKALRLSAALAYYSIFSIAPLLVISLGLAGLFLDEKALTGQLHDQLRGYVGSKAADAVQSMVQSASTQSHGIVATIVGFVTLMFGASGVLGELKDALNTIWEVKPKAGGSAFGTMLHEKFLNFGMVIVIGFLLMVSLLLSAGVAALSKHFESFLALPAPVWAIIAFLLSFAVITTMIALIFKVLPDAKIHWRDVWIGSVITAFFFELGKTGLAWYLGRESTSSSYGAAGAVVLLLLWVYYASCILFFGAEFTQIFAAAHGRFIVPDAHGERITTGERAEQGLPPVPAAVPAPAPPREATFPGAEAGPPTWRHRIVQPLLKYLEGRGLLASIEAKEALQSVVAILLGGLASIIVIFAGWLLLATALVGMLTHVLKWGWIAAAATTGGLHVVLAACLCAVTWRKFSVTVWFQETIQQLREDRIWLRGGERR
jgi:membrane protein